MKTILIVRVILGRSPTVADAPGICGFCPSTSATVDEPSTTDRACRSVGTSFLSAGRSSGESGSEVSEPWVGFDDGHFWRDSHWVANLPNETFLLATSAAIFVFTLLSGWVDCKLPAGVVASSACEVRRGLSSSASLDSVSELSESTSADATAALIASSASLCVESGSRAMSVTR